MRGGIVAVDAAAEDGDGETARVEGAAVRVPVDTAGEAADHDEARGGELAAEHPGDVGAVRRAGAGADDRHGRTVEQLELAAAAHEQARRRVEDRAEGRREAGRRARQPAQAALRQSGQVGALVELAPEAREALAPRRGDEVRVRVRRERGEGQLAHADRSSVGVR